MDIDLSNTSSGGIGTNQFQDDMTIRVFGHTNLRRFFIAPMVKGPFTVQNDGGLTGDVEVRYRGNREIVIAQASQKFTTISNELEKVN